MVAFFSWIFFFFDFFTLAEISLGSFSIFTGVSWLGEIGED